MSRRSRTMRARSPFYFWIIVLLCIPLIYFVIDRTYFEIVALETTGTVERIWGRDDRCGTKRRRYDCTKFTAAVRYEVQGAEYGIDVSAGTARGHGEPISQSDYRVGGGVMIAYNPRKPGHAYRNTFWDIWGAPVLTFFMQICAFFGGLKEKRESG